jgi:hypothetical protein
MMKPDLDRPHIPTPEAQKRTRLSKSYLAFLLRKGTLEGFRMGRDWFIYTDSLEHFLTQEHKPGPKGPRKKSLKEEPQKLVEPSSGAPERKLESVSEVQDRPGTSSENTRNEDQTKVED